VATTWRQIQWREFQRKYKSVLDTRHQCRHCEGPVSESMHACPWCGFDHPSRGCETTMPASCPRCERGVKKDWHYCAWCYGPGFEIETDRRYADKRYTAKCANPRCREPQMPFMRYCPWCRTKVKKPWKLPGSKKSCRACNWGIAAEFWNFCPWCREPIRKE
jgi:eukaryotic-like serine/threonine-protein kinase